MTFTLQPLLKKHPKTQLAGHKVRMSFSYNQTPQLWHGFMPRLKEIPNRLGRDLYSIEVYDGVEALQQFDPDRPFEKWAAVPVEPGTELPGGFRQLDLEEGLYAVFPYRERMGPIAAFYGAILTQWLPSSGYRLANRPHFAVMGPDFRQGDPDALEHFWVPVK